jgi:hypothetical protein
VHLGSDPTARARDSVRWKWGTDVDEAGANEEVKREIARGNYARAITLAEAEGLSEREIRDLKEKALWQAAALDRNAGGTKALAEEYGLSPDEVKGILAHEAQTKRSRGEDRELMPRYDYRTNDYLTFEEWLAKVLAGWPTL